MGVNTEFTPLK